MMLTDGAALAATIAGRTPEIAVVSASPTRAE
jgi:hypothetical protein